MISAKPDHNAFIWIVRGQADRGTVLRTLRMNSAVLYTLTRKTRSDHSVVLRLKATRRWLEVYHPDLLEPFDAALAEAAIVRDDDPEEPHV